MNNSNITNIQGLEVYEDNIYYLIDEYIEKYNIQDLKKESQNVWNGLLLYIYKNSFKIDNSILCLDNNSIYNGYNINSVLYILDIYINLCYNYEKEVSIMGFSKITGIERETIYNWANKERQPNSAAVDIFKKLTEEREESLSNMLISGRRNPVGILGSLNRHYGWNMGQPKGLDGSKKTGFEALPDLNQPLQIVSNTDTI